MRGKLWISAIAVAGILLCVRRMGQAQENESGLIRQSKTIDCDI